LVGALLVYILRAVGLVATPRGLGAGGRNTGFGCLYTGRMPLAAALNAGFAVGLLYAVETHTANVSAQVKIPVIRTTLLLPV
jgi:hypothetical protein